MRDSAGVRVRRLRVSHSSHDLDSGILGRELKGRERKGRKSNNQKKKIKYRRQMHENLPMV